MIIWHVGGGGGGYGDAQTLAEKYKATLIVFEANEEREETTAATQAYNVCVADYVGPVLFNVFKHDAHSSLFTVNPEHAQEVTGNPKLRTWGCHGAVRETKHLWAETIDHLVEGGIPAPDFLSLDAQGSEHRIMRGALRTLRTMVGILTEFQTAEVYKEQGLLQDHLRLLRSHGFRLAELPYREYWTRDGTRLLTGGDALFLNFGTLPKEKIEMRDKIASFFGLRA